MNPTSLIVRTLFIFLIAFNIFVYAEPNNLSLLKTQIKTYHDSGEYVAELNQVASKASSYITQRADQNAHLATPQKLALVLDIDETSISNYDNILQNDFAANAKIIEESLLSTKKQAIQPILDLYNNARAHGVTVFFVTGRVPKYKSQTVASLHNAGYAHWAKIYFRPDVYTPKSIVPFKSQTRAEIVKQGYTVIASIGDQWSDLQGGYAESVFKLPNPYYFIN
jgi:predicted secreted acid phosphatase